MTGEIVTRATALRNASIIIRPVRPGSFLFELVVLMEANPATTAAVVALAAAPFYDFLKVTFKRATGFLDADPESTHLRRLYERREPTLHRPPADLDDLAERLEGSLQDAHRPIYPDEGIRQIVIGTPRTPLVTFNAATKDWVNTRDAAEELVEYRGNMTRYNALSRNGRAFIDELERVVPIRPDGDFDAADLANLTWSLHGSNTGGRKKLLMRARPVTSASGLVKRLLLSDCQVDPDERA